MIRPIQNAVMGLQNAGNDAYRAASDISRAVRTAADTYAQAAAREGGRSSYSPSPATPRPQGRLSAGTAAPDLPTAIVDLKQALHAYKANAQVLRVADEMAEQLLDVKT